MKKAESGCKGFYLNKNGERCEVHEEKIITLNDCKKCTCPNNQYKK